MADPLRAFKDRLSAYAEKYGGVGLQILLADEQARQDRTHHQGPPMTTESKERELRDKDTLIGSLLDAWQGTPNDLRGEMRESGCGRYLDALESFMNDPETNPPPAHIERALAQPVVGWRPIESAPREGTEILVCRAINADGQPIAAENFGIFCHVAAWWEGDAAWIVYCSMTKDPETHFTPTHWMPLPAPPGEQAQPVVDEAMVERDRWVRAWRNRFISERMNSYPDDEYELRTAKAEADANEFEAALEKAFESRAALTAAQQKEG